MSIFGTYRKFLSDFPGNRTQYGRHRKIVNTQRMYVGSNKISIVFSRHCAGRKLVLSTTIIVIHSVKNNVEC